MSAATIEQIVEQAVEGLEKANANLEPELLTTERARELMAGYARAEKLVAFGLAALTRKLDDPAELARLRGTPVGKAKAVVATGEAMASSQELSSALKQGDISPSVVSSSSGSQVVSPAGHR